MPPINSPPQSQIRRLREKLGLTRRALSSRLGISETTVENWEKKPAYRWVTLIQLCILFSCAPQDLLRTNSGSDLSTIESVNTLEGVRNSVSAYAIIPPTSSCRPPLINELSHTRIAELRNERGWTQEELAEILGVAKNTVQNWERNRTSSMQFARFRDLCDILLCQPRELVDYVPEIAIPPN